MTVNDSPVASAQFSVAVGELPKGADTAAAEEKGLETLRRQVAEAHKRGIKARYWELPAFPIWKRNRVWKMLSDEGVDLLNVDDLDAAVGFWN